MWKPKHIQRCVVCGNIIFDGTPGEIYTGDIHEKQCKGFQYEDLYSCVNCEMISSDKNAICECEEKLNQPRKKHSRPNEWVITIDGVVIPQDEYDWTEDGHFYFPRSLLELAQKYCSIHKEYKKGDEVKVSMRCDWEVEI